MFENILRLLLGAWWGYLFTEIANDIGTVTESVTLTVWDAVTLVGFIIVIIFLGVITIASVVND